MLPPKFCAALCLVRQLRGRLYPVAAFLHLAVAASLLGYGLSGPSGDPRNPLSLNFWNLEAHLEPRVPRPAVKVITAFEDNRAGDRLAHVLGKHLLAKAVRVKVTSLGDIALVLATPAYGIRAEFEGQLLLFESS